MAQIAYARNKIFWKNLANTEDYVSKSSMLETKILK